MAKDEPEAKALEELKPLKQFYMKQIEELIKNTLDPDARAALEQVLKEISHAKDAASIAAAIANAPSAATAALAKVETPEERVQRLTAEMHEIKDKADKIVEGLPLTDEQLARKEEIEKAIKEAKNKEEEREAWKKLAQFYKDMGWEYDKPELVKIWKRAGIKKYRET